MLKLNCLLPCYFLLNKTVLSCIERYVSGYVNRTRVCSSNNDGALRGFLAAGSKRLSEPMQLKPYILFSRRITRGAVRRVRNSRVEGRESFLLETRVDQIRATPFIKSRVLVFLIEREHTSWGIAETYALSSRKRIINNRLIEKRSLNIQSFQF